MQDYFNILSQQIHPSDAEFRVKLNTDCPVYLGHFPGNPIAPGACNIEMVRECISLIHGRQLRISEIKLCKFLLKLYPQSAKELVIQVSWNDSNYSVIVLEENTVAVQLKMVLV